MPRICCFSVNREDGCSVKIVIDESVSYGLAEILRKAGYDVISIADTSSAGKHDEEIFQTVTENNAILITRDYHFTNPLRFPPDKTGGIIYIRHGNLTSAEEIDLVQKFLSLHSYSGFSRRLVTLYKGRVKIR